MEPTSLSLAVRGLRQHLAETMPFEEGSILIGHPSAALNASSSTGDLVSAVPHVNLFAYRVEPGGYADSTPTDPIYVRLYCLITALGSDTTGEAGQMITAGEQELRIQGAVIAALHQRPTVLLTQDGETYSQLQVVPTPLTLEALNNLWSTQKDAAYRLSLAYELALLPVPLQPPGQPAPLVVRVEVPEPRFGRLPRSGWVPELRLVDKGGSMHQVLVVERQPGPRAFRLFAAGAEPVALELAWQRWDSTVGFRAMSPPLSSLTVEVVELPKVAEGSSVGATFELDISTTGQVVAHARRADGTMSNRVVVVIVPEEGDHEA